MALFGVEPVTIQRQAIVVQARELVFALVRDVASYPLRFSWCREGRVLARGVDDLPWEIASLTVEAARMPVRFSTRNRFLEPEWIEMTLVEGPFQSLEGRWSFHAIGETASRVELSLRFQPRGRWLGAALSRGFARLADRMVDDFCQAAGRLGGCSAAG